MKKLLAFILLTSAFCFAQVMHQDSVVVAQKMKQFMTVKSQIIQQEAEIYERQKTLDGLYRDYTSLKTELELRSELLELKKGKGDK